MKAKRIHRGFTILELAVGMAAAGLVLIPMTNYYIQQVNRQQVSQAAGDILAIGEAAQNYQADNGIFPDSAGGNNCAGALAVLAAAGYLGNATNRTAWAGAYTFACPTTGTGTTFNISVVTPLGRGGSNNAAQSLLRQIFRGSIAADNVTVTSSFPVASNAPALSLLLHRYATAGHPEYNQMETAIDMNANAINNGGEVTSNAAGTAFYAPNGTVESDVAAATGAAFHSATSYFKSDQADTSRPSFYATHSYFQSDRPVAGGPAFYASSGSFSSGAPASTDAFTTANGNYYTQTGTYVSDSPGVAFQANNGSVSWGAAKSRLATDQGGSIELGANNFAANPVAGGAPYIDFHYGDGAGEDYNTRLQNNANGQLTAVANVFHVGGSPAGGAAGNVIADGQVSAKDIITTLKGIRTLSQAVQDVAIVDAADSAANRTFTESCPNTETPTIHTAISQVAEGPQAYPLNQIVTYATTNSTSTTAGTTTTTWTVNMGIIASDPFNTNMQTPASGYGRILVILKCT